MLKKPELELIITTYKARYFATIKLKANMSDLDLNSLIRQVKTNCNISDAKFWGNYSICGLLLRLRELFRHENRIMPWEEISKTDISDWISNRENLWHEKENEDFVDLYFGEEEYPPFDVKAINESLGERGLVYGAGLGINMKPSFFLGELISKEVMEGHEVYISGDEFARDLSAYPAMLQDNTIYARRDALSIILYGRFEELSLRKCSGALSYAFADYGLHPGEQGSEAAYDKILKIMESELDVYVHHEIGEAFEGKKLGSEWKNMLSVIQNRRVEFFIRGIKDVLSDTSEKGMIKYIIRKNNKGSLGFYISFIGGFRKLIFPEIMNAFQDFTGSEDWDLINETRKNGYIKAERLASRVLEIYGTPDDKTKLDELIEKELIGKTTISR